MSLTRYQAPELATWSPFDRLSTLRDEMNRLFDLSFDKSSPQARLFTGWAPALDVHQDKENVYVKAELPGMKKEEIEITLHDGVLNLSGERRREEVDGENSRSERFFGRFHRSVAVPTRVQSDNVSASYKDGILTVTLPKAEEAKPKQIEVSVS